jgi:predicted DNA-binding transcriptional regulator AlpA
MLLAEIIEGNKEALRVAEVAQILDVSIKKIYRMAAKGQIPSLKFPVQSDLTLTILPHG